MRTTRRRVTAFQAGRLSSTLRVRSNSTKALRACITHFYHCGIHDGHNNLLKGQCNYVTGHTHSLKVTPWTNAMGQTLWAVNTGTLADALANHNLNYQQGRHGNHRSGFAVLTYKNGELLMPELAMKHDEDSFVFRGHVLNADTAEIV